MSKIQSSILILLSTFFSTALKAQSCFNVNAGKDTIISCLQTMLDLKARIPNVKTTEDYTVVAIPYAPYAYKTPGGTTDPLVNADDHFSDSFDIPFPFCFYGRTYKKSCVGSNGVITFDHETNAKTREGFIIERGDKIPFAGGAPDVPGIFYAPRASIFLAYYDMNPATSPGPNKSKIEWRVEGTAPCRRFVVSYFQIGNFATSVCSNDKNLCTMQAVMYEGTGIIDVFYQDKPACPEYQDGLAIAGLQNWQQNQHVELPGKNGTVWTASNEGYRYVPNGTTSLLSRVELYKNNVLLSTGTVIDLGTGEMEATFSNIIQPEASASYVVKAFYKQCDNFAAETEGSDTMVVTKVPSDLTRDIINPLCNGNTGTITVTAPLAPNIEYSIDGGTNWQSGAVFIRPAGNYTILARGVGTLCTASATADITQPAALNIAAISKNTTCTGNDGTITITANGGIAPYKYSIDNGVTFQGSNIFPVNPGNYNSIIIQDASGCRKATVATVILNDQMFLSLGADTTICAEQSVTLDTKTNTETTIFKWTPALGLNNDAIKSPVATPADTIRYTLTAHWGICQRTEDILVKVLRKPVVFAGNDTAVCYNTNAQLRGAASNLSGTVKYAWSPSVRVNPPNAPIASARPAATQLYTLTVTDNYGCNFLVKDEVLVSVRPPVIAFAGNDTTAIYGMPHQMTGSGGTNYLWTPATGLSNAFVQNPQATLFTDSHFSLVVSNDIGCSDTDDIFIKVYKGPAYYIPTAFSPNGDGANDVFRPIPVGIKQTDYFAVYNRYGALVFKTNQWLHGWDGTYRGKKVAAGTYVWMIKGIDRNGKVVEMKGSVILMH